MTTTSGTSSPEYNVNREPALQCLRSDEHESWECDDPAHRIAAMYQTYDRVNVEIYNADCEVVRVIPFLKEEDALAEMTDWITIQRDKGKRNNGGPTYKVAL
jgi:hypothetical protein